MAGGWEGAYRSPVHRHGNGADDEATRRVVEGDGQEDHLVAGRRDRGSDQPDNEAVEGTNGSPRVFGLGRPAERQTNGD